MNTRNGNVESGDYPGNLAEIVTFFETLSEAEKRENLILHAESARNQEPNEKRLQGLPEPRANDSLMSCRCGRTC